MGHKAIIAKIDRVVPIEGADRIKIAMVLGEQVIVSKEWQQGMVGVFFPVDVQISEEYCQYNNLFRDSSKNQNNEVKGFFEDSRRVRAQPFMKVRSSGYFSTLESLDVFGYFDYKLGDQFDEINGMKVCEKYISEKVKQQIAREGVKRTKVVSFPTFAKHVDSDQFKHFADRIEKGSIIYFHAKVHGTSFRVGYLPKKVTLPWWKEQVNKIVPVFPTEQLDFVVGTRNVILDNPNKEGYHGSEEFRFEVFRSLQPYLTEGITLYGEIAGYANGKSIMPNHDIKALKDKKYIQKYGDTNVYSYGCTFGSMRYHVYRATRQSLDGTQVDMTQAELEKWCDSRGIVRTLEVHPPMIYDGDVEALRTLVEELTERPSLLTEDFINPHQIGEGIILRVENGKAVPDFYKSKSYSFRVMEGLCETEDEETLN